MPIGPTGQRWLFSPHRSQVSTTLWPVVFSATTGHESQLETETQRKRFRRNGMNIQNKTILITGANRGIGRALVDEALRRGAKTVYAGTRSGQLQNADNRVTPLKLDVTNSAQIQAAAQKVESLDVLINKAGVALYDDLT